MAEPKRCYHIWQDGAEWHWEVGSFRDEVVASGVAKSSSAARKAVFAHPLKPPARMSIYYFHLRSTKLRDTEGQEFPNDDAARDEAAAVARDLSRHRNVVTDDRVVVTNADGIVIHEEPLLPR